LASRPVSARSTASILGQPVEMILKVDRDKENCHQATERHVIALLNRTFNTEVSDLAEDKSAEFDPSSGVLEVWKRAKGSTNEKQHYAQHQDGGGAALRIDFFRPPGL